MSNSPIKIPLSVGYILDGLRKAEELSISEFARRAKIDPVHMNRIIHGQVGLTADVAINLEWTGVTPLRLMMIQVKNQLALAKEARRKERFR